MEVAVRTARYLLTLAGRPQASACDYVGGLLVQARNGDRSRGASDCGKTLRASPGGRGPCLPARPTRSRSLRSQAGGRASPSTAAPRRLPVTAHRRVRSRNPAKSDLAQLAHFRLDRHDRETPQGILGCAGRQSQCRLERRLERRLVRGWSW
jgi:hypothetical protein